MAKNLVRHSYVDMLGTIWMPAITCSLRKDLSSYDIENIRGYSEVVSGTEGKITREGLEHWLLLHSGDFQDIKDFSASIEDGEETLDYPWTSEENEMAYLDTISEEF